MLMFGGSHTGADVLGDTWLFWGNPGTWQLCTDTNGCPSIDEPDARCCVGMLYDSQRDRIVIFGGQTTPGPDAYRDMWSWIFGDEDDPLTEGWHCISPMTTCDSPTP
jgi:hypothetical protein